jgi:hypothetical protein
MDDIDTRAANAGSLWTRGDQAMAKGDRDLAYRLYTEAHDLVVDCARLHIRAHQKLQSVTRFHASRKEYITDRVLLALAPFGLFELIAFYFRSRVGQSAHCRRS